MKKKMTLENHATILENFENFIADRERKNCSKATIRFYKEVPKVLETLCSMNDDVTIINEQFSHDLIKRLQNSNLAQQSINSYLRRFRAFAYYLMNEGVIESFSIHMPHADKPLKNIYTQGDPVSSLSKTRISEYPRCSYRERNWSRVYRGLYADALKMQSEYGIIQQ